MCSLDDGAYQFGHIASFGEARELGGCTQHLLYVIAASGNTVLRHDPDNPAARRLVSQFHPATNPSP